MNQSEIDERRLETDRRANDPQPGNYWHEMFCPICVVVHRLPGYVVVCKKTKDAGEGYQTWDLDKLEMMSLAEFKKWLSYGTIPGYWADSYNNHDWVVEYFNSNPMVTATQQ